MNPLIIPLINPKSYDLEVVRKTYWVTLTDDVSNTFAGSLLIFLTQDISR